MPDQAEKMVKEFEEMANALGDVGLAFNLTAFRCLPNSHVVD